ncbi:MAG TPA: 50S ribosomal protein L25 [Armatimonadota bacterium]|jgi:large subunit ribosomal protein L25
MEQVVIKAELREMRGNGPARRLRETGMVPAIVYGQGYDNVAIAVPLKEIYAAMHGAQMANVLIDLKVPGLDHSGGVAAMVKNVQREPIRHTLWHIDFQWVSLLENVTVTVPINLVGEAAGLLVGGVIDQVIHEVEVECLPTAIPEHLTVDISGMEIRDTRHVSDLPVTEGVRILAHAEDVVVAIAPPMGEEPVEPVSGEGEILEAAAEEE